MNHRTLWIALLALAMIPTMSLAQKAAAQKTLPGKIAIKKTKVTYLGVASTPVPEELRAQVKLPKEIGLLVRFVQKGTGAAKAGLKTFDIMHKLDKQILVNQHQLRTLIRMRKPGDKIVLTVIRQGKSQDVTIELGENVVIEPAPVQPLQHRPGQLKIQPIPLIDLKDQGVWAAPRNQAQMLKRFEEQLKNSGMKQEQIDQILKQQKEMLEKMGNIPWGRVPHNAGGAPRAPSQLNFKNHTTMAYSDNDHSLKITIEDAHKALVAKDRDGKVLFQGPINTDEQRKLIPAVVLKKLLMLENQIKIEIRRGQPAQPAAPAKQPKPEELKL
jgi:serine protease Do